MNAPKNMKKYAWIIVGVVLVIISLKLILEYQGEVTMDGEVTITFHSQPQSSTQPSKAEPVYERLTITQGNWVEAKVPDFTKHQYDFACGSVGTDVPFRVEINGGKEDGGETIDVPSYSDMEGLDWKAPSFPNTVMEVRFTSLSGKENAKVWYKFTPK